MARNLPLIVDEGSVAHRGLRLARLGAVVAIALTLPYVVQTFQLSQITSVLILATAIVGLNLLSGFGGQISLGHAAFFGLGAYTAGVLSTKYGWALPLTFVAGMLLCFVVGVLVGVPALRLQGMYLALVTLAIGVIFPNVVRRFESFTGGSTGLIGVAYPPPAIPYFAGKAGATVWLYWLSVVALGLSCLVVWNIMRSRVGRGIVALRDNESAAIVMGVNRALVRTVLFGVSAAIAGLAGGLFAVKSGVLVPDSFSLLLTIELLVAMILGGSASFWGPLFGAAIIYYVPVWTADIGGGPIAGVMFGTVVIVMVFVLPSGIAGGLKQLAKRFVRIAPRPPLTATRQELPTANAGLGAADQSLAEAVPAKRI